MFSEIAKNLKSIKFLRVHIQLLVYFRVVQNYN